MSFVEKCHLIKTQDNHQVALWQIASQISSSKFSPEKCVFLTHGTFSDKRICLGIAKFLAFQGFTCLILEWRGHGNSGKSAEPFNFDTIAKYDIKASFDFMQNQLGVSSWHCVTHSGGGICLTMCLIYFPEYQRNIKSISMVACQAFGAASSIKSFIRLKVAKRLSKRLGFIPAKPLKLGVVNETYATMQPWFDWNLSKQFVSSDKSINYQTQMVKIKVPIYAIAGAGDKWIAPPKGCYQFWQAFKNSTNQFREFGEVQGNLEDYSHSRILLSRNASQEVWQSILQWIENYQ